MPQAQVIDLNPRPRTEETTLEKTLGGFADKYRQGMEQRRESDALKDIYSHYQDGKNIDQAIIAAQTNHRLSPTTKVNTISQLTKFKEHNTKLQEEQKKQRENEDLIAGIEKERNVPPGTYAKFKSNPALAEKVTKEPKVPLSQQPIPDKEQDAINRVTSSDAYKKANLPGKENLLLNAGVSAANVEKHTKTAAAQDKNDLARQKFEAQNALQVHATTKDYDETIAKEAKSAKHQMSALKDIEKRIDNVQPTDMANVMRFFGETGKKISDAILTGDQATIQASIPAFLEGRKELFGVRLSDADLALLSDKMIDIGKNKEANKAIYNLTMKYAKKAILREEIGSKIKKANKGYRPIDYNDQLEETYGEMTKPIQVINPKNGKVISIPAFELEDALTAGATLYNE